MLDPHLPKKMLADEVAIPTLRALGKAIERVCPGLEQEKIVLSIISIIGQLVHAIHLNEMFCAEEDIGLPIPNLAEVVNHIVDFSAAGIRAAVQEKS